MKRVIAVFLILAALFPALLLPAAAADPEEYVFEKQDIGLYADFYPDGSLTYFCNEHIPEGSYKVDFILTDDLILAGATYSVVVSSFYVHYGDIWLYGDLFRGCPLTFDCSISGPGYFDSAVLTSYLVSVDQESSYFVFPENFSDSLRCIVLTPCFTVGSQLDVFVGDVVRGMFELSGTNLITIILVALGIVVTPVLLWFGYRFVKRKVVVSFRKGKV